MNVLHRDSREDNLPRVLTIDAGHTRIKFAVCLCPPERLPQVVHEVAVEEVDSIPWDKISDWISSTKTTHCILTGSNQTRVQEIKTNWKNQIKKRLRVLNKKDVPVVNRTMYPSKVGVDRLLTSVAVNFIREESHPAIIVDSGTAVTVDYVNSHGIFCGGAILPGVRLCAKALHEYTTSLPHYDAKKLLDHTPNPVGEDTYSAIASGIYWGHVGAVRELIQKHERHAEWCGEKPPMVFFTGGASPMLRSEFPNNIFFDELSLQGLALTALHLQQR